MEALVKFENTVKYFGKKKALDNINLEIKSGQIIGLLGPNESGKTTLLNCMAGLAHLNSGDILVEGQSIKEAVVKSKISYMPVIDVFFPKWTAEKARTYYENLFLDFDAEKNKKLLKDMDISENIEFRAMSSGTQAKVKLIFTLSRKAKLYLLDEPFANIDLVAR